MQFSGGSAAPIVDLCTARDPQAAVARCAKDSLPQLALRLAEGDGLDGAAIVPRHDGAQMTIADDIGLDDAHRSSRDERGWPASTIGAACLDRSYEVRIDARRGKHRVDQQCAVIAGAGDGGSKPFVQEISQRVQLVSRDGQPCRHSVAATGNQQTAILGRQHGRAKINARDRTAGALARTGIVNRHNDRGTPCLFLDASGDDADHAGMPASPGDKRHGPVALRREQFFRLSLYRRLDNATFLVELVQLGSDARGLDRVFRRQQTHAQISLAYPPASIDAGTERKSQIMA